MGWWPFGRGTEKKASAAGGVISFSQVGRPVWTDRDFAKLADEAYVRNAVAYRCTKLIAGSGATVPWLLNRKSGAEIDQHPLLDLLSRPGPMVGGHELFEAFLAYLLLAGNTYLESVGPDNRPPRELWAHRPDRMRVIPGETAMPKGFEYQANGVIYRWDVDPVTGAGPILHLKEFHPLNDWYGLSRVQPAAYGVDRHNAASGHDKAMLDNGGRSTGALVFEPVNVNGETKNAPQEVIEAAEEELSARDRDLTKRGRAHVFGGNVKWLDMMVTPRDMDFQAGKADAARDICLSFGVPHILVVPGQSTYNNVREAKLELWEDTILPLLDKTVDKLNSWLTPQFGDDLKLGIDYDEIPALEPRRESKRKSVTELLEKGVIDEDEAREALQYGPRSPDSVRKVDASVLNALIQGYQADQAMFTPLFRYMLSVGLVKPGSTIEDLMAAADQYMTIDDPEDAAAQTPPALPAPTPAPQPGDGAQEGPPA